jgi:hypothetical protein
MVQQTLNIGATANDGTGDTLRAAMDKVNDNFDEIYASPIISDFITITGNEIRANRSNDDLVLEPSGTGQVMMPQLTVDSNINIKDNVISTLITNSDLELAPAGTGNVLIGSADINGGNIDNTIIGATTPVAGTFTTLTANNSATIDGVLIQDNTISATTNADLELSSAGSGTVSLNGLKFPTADGTINQVLKTDGNGNLGFATAAASLTNSAINDGTASITTSITSTIDSFSTSTYRSAKYFISVSDSSNGRFEIVEANVVHGPSADSTTEAYITVFGSTTNHTSPLLTLTVEISDGDVILKGTNNSVGDTNITFQRCVIDL